MCTVKLKRTLINIKVLLNAIITILLVTLEVRGGRFGLYDTLYFGLTFNNFYLFCIILFILPISNNNCILTYRRNMKLLSKKKLTIEFFGNLHTTRSKFPKLEWLDGYLPKMI